MTSPLSDGATGRPMTGSWSIPGRGKSDHQRSDLDLDLHLDQLYLA